MKKALKEMFCENSGKISLMRVMSFMCLQIGLFLAVFIIMAIGNTFVKAVTVENSTAASTLVSASALLWPVAAIIGLILMFAFFPKVIQKFAENSLMKFLNKKEQS